MCTITLHTQSLAYQVLRFVSGDQDDLSEKCFAAYSHAPRRDDIPLPVVSERLTRGKTDGASRTIHRNEIALLVWRGSVVLVWGSQGFVSVGFIRRLFSGLAARCPRGIVLCRADGLMRLLMAVSSVSRFQYYCGVVGRQGGRTL